MMTRYTFVFCLFIIKSLVNSKYYDDYYSFDGCVPKKTCNAISYPEIYKTYIRGLGPACEDENSIIRDYFKCVDKFFECGYLRTYDKNGTVTLNPEEGVRILDGVDISHLTEDALEALLVPESIIKKLTPFFGVKGIDASNKLEAEKLSITPAESEFLYTVFLNERMIKFEEDFLNLTPDLTENKARFQNLTLEAKVGLLSIDHLYGEIPKEFHDYIFNNQWDALSHSLKRFEFPANIRNGNTYKNNLRKNIDSYLIDSIDEHIQDGRVLGAFVIDLTDQYKQDLVKYETYINTVKSILKSFYDTEQCYTCKNRDIHDYCIIVYRNESLLLTNFTADYNQTMAALEKIIIPDSWSTDSRKRNTADAIGGGVYMLTDQPTAFDKMKTIFLFSNGDPDDELEIVKPWLLNNQINLAVLDMSLGAAMELPLIAEGPYNYLSYDVAKYQNSTVNQKCLGKQVANIFANQNINLLKNSTYRNSSIVHNNTIHFQTVRSKGKNLKISLNLNTFPEENWMQLFVSYEYPNPDWFTSSMKHEGTNYLPLKTLVFGNDENHQNALDKDQIVYFTLQGSNSDFGIKIEDCDPAECKVGTNINDNDYPFPQWLLAILIILTVMVALFGIWYLLRCYRKKESIEDVEAGINSKYRNIEE
jgi:hypothetical protein